MLYWTLMGLVLISYAAPVYIVVTQFGILRRHAPLWLLHTAGLVTLLVTFKPVLDWIRPRVHHVVYATEETNLSAIGQIDEALVHSHPDSAMLKTMAEATRQTLNVPYARIEMLNGLAAASGEARRAGVWTRTELVYRDVPVGWMEVMSRLPNEPLTVSEYRVLHTLARQVSITLHAAQLSDALQASREQLVLAREEERRRIRRDLHDGLGPTLASLRLQLGALRRIVSGNAEAQHLIDELRDDVRGATAEIRRLVYDLRPPMLDEFGLLGALRNLNLMGEDVESVIDVPPVLPALPAAIEVALYRVAAAALHNVARHARATRCTLRLVLSDDTLVLTVSDNGVGLPDTYLPGVGHLSMYERAAELGGTVTIASLPTGGTCVTALFRLKGGFDA